MVVPVCVLNWGQLYLSEGHLQWGSFPLFLGRAQSLIPVFPSLFSFLLIGRGGYSLGGPAEVECWG